MNINRRQLFKDIITGGTLGVVGRELIRPIGSKIQGVLSGEDWKLSIDDIVHGAGKTHLPSETHRALVTSIAEALGAPEKNIHALLTQERPSGQKTDFFIGDGFGQDNGKPAILFERHTFWQALESQGKKIGLRGGIDLANLVYKAEGHDGSLLSKNGYGSSNKFGYGLYTQQYDKLRTIFDWGKKHASALSQSTGLQKEKIQRAIEDAALMACSWGGGQVLGNNYEDLEYDSVRELVENASTVHGMAENFVRFVKHHRGITVGGRKYSYLTEIRKNNPDWKIISMCHNGGSVRSVNPEYIPHVRKYAQEYDEGLVPSGFARDALSGAVAGVAIAGTLVGSKHLTQKKGHKKIAKQIPTMTRRRVIKIMTQGAVGGVALRALSKIQGLLGIKLPSWKLSKTKQASNQQISEGFDNPTLLRSVSAPTRIQSTILNPWLSANTGVVKRFNTIAEAQSDKDISRISAITDEYRCEGLGSALMQTLYERMNKNNSDYLYIHQIALDEIRDIAKKLGNEAKEKLGLKEGYRLRVIITSALRDGEYSKKYLSNSSPNSTHNTGRAFDIAERFELITPNGEAIEINEKVGVIWTSIRSILIGILNKKHKDTLYYMREGIPPHFHCVAIGGTKKVATK